MAETLEGRGQKEVVLADGKPVLRDLAQWMNGQKNAQSNCKLIPFREKKLNSIGFMWDKWEHEWHAMFCALKRFKEKEGRWPRICKAEDKREVVLADGKAVLGTGNVDGQPKERQKNWKIESTPGREVERDWLCVG